MVTVKNQDTVFESPEPGSYVGVCYKIIDIGTQESEYQGKKIRRRQVVIGWELAEKNSKNEPFVVSSFFTQSLGEKSKLRPTLEGWRGAAFTPEELEGFDLSQLLGKPCIVSLVKNEKNKIKVNAVSKLAKGMVAHKLVNPMVHFDLDDFSVSVFDLLSDKMKEIIKKSPEYALATNAGWLWRCGRGLSPRGTRRG
jgi:hypothetical protein